MVIKPIRSFILSVTFIRQLNYFPYLQFDQFVVIDLQPVMSADALKSSHPVYVPVYETSEINEIFDKISYGKVCHTIAHIVLRRCILYMLRLQHSHVNVQLFVM